MIVFPNCKINLGLRILDKRADGFHNLESIFFPVQLNDALEIIESEELQFNIQGKKIEGIPGDNICLKAYHLLKVEFNLPPVSIYLYKNIPIGAGMGGGSADGAFTLKLLNEKFNLRLSASELKNYAAELGSDCAFFIDNKPSNVTGRGEVMKDAAVNLEGYYIVLVCPRVLINTAWAFKELANHRAQHKATSVNTPSLRDIIQQPVDTWKHQLTNDFEPVIFSHYPQLSLIKEQLYANGASYAAMSGSGSTVFGIFKGMDKPMQNVLSINPADIYSFKIA